MSIDPEIKLPLDPPMGPLTTEEEMFYYEIDYVNLKNSDTATLELMKIASENNVKSAWYFLSRQQTLMTHSWETRLRDTYGEDGWHDDSTYRDLFNMQYRNYLKQRRELRAIEFILHTRN